MIRSILCKLKATLENDMALEDTSQAFARACQDIHKVALEDNLKDAFVLHKRLYYSLSTTKGRIRILLEIGEYQIFCLYARVVYEGILNWSYYLFNN